jgi:hypothetical protein
VRDRVNSVRKRLALRDDGNGRPWQLWLNTPDREVSDSIESWLLAEPSLRREGGLAFAEGRLGPVDRGAPSGMAFCLLLATSGPISAGDLVTAIVSWRAVRPDADRLELALVIPESALTIRIGPSV